MQREFLGIFGQLFKGEQEINSTHTARQAKSSDIHCKQSQHNCSISVLICVKSKHGCSSGMMSWTHQVVFLYIFYFRISCCWVDNRLNEQKWLLVVVVYGAHLGWRQNCSNIIFKWCSCVMVLFGGAKCCGRVFCILLFLVWCEVGHLSS